MLLFNSLTKKKEELATIAEDSVMLYVCGITPYDTTHLGHAFLYMFFDVLTRYLTHKGYKVNYVQNVTDIDDDILKRAKEEDRDWKELGEHWTQRFLSDYASLNMQMPTQYVKATETIPTIIEMVAGIVEKGFGYVKEGHVYFEIGKFKDYGQLSGLSREEMLPISAERGNNTHDSLKKNQLDFILWQKAKEGEPSWDSPWGKGRPGWHIECSAMIYKHLGPQIDIHGGGADLIYPHHESEIAQSESFTQHKPFVQIWMHAAMLMYQGEKMSKSLGNMIFVKDLLENYSADAIRYVLLSHHYRTVWEFRDDDLVEADKLLKTLEGKCDDQDAGELRVFETYLEDDMNTPGAIEYIRTEMSGPSLRKALSILGFSCADKKDKQK